MHEQSILIVDDEEGLRHSLSVNLKKEGYAPTTASGAEKALAVLSESRFDMILCDIRMPGIDGLAFLEEIQKRDIPGTVIMMSAYGDNDTAIDAMRRGAYDYISKPFKKDEVILTIRKAEERERLRRENRELKESVQRTYRFENILSKNDSMLKLFETIRRITDYKTTVLITGESGTGKELVARAIHFNGRRREKPFIPVNCGAIPETLLESELFGHVKGAFTDARTDKTGLVAEADQGTLFLDEIGELPQPLQVKLLRVLQEGDIRKVGDTKNTKVDIRVIAATSRDLEKEVEEKRFREDLYYRLNVFPILLPPLRARPEDIPLLTDHFVKVFNSRLELDVKGVSKDAAALMLKYQWPGNVRELENALERAVLLCEGERILPEHLTENIRLGNEKCILSNREDLSVKKNVRLVEEQLIRQALLRTGGNRTHAAKLLEISHRTLLYKIQEYGITK